MDDNYKLHRNGMGNLQCRAWSSFMQLLFKKIGTCILAISKVYPALALPTGWNADVELGAVVELEWPS